MHSGTPRSKQSLDVAVSTSVDATTVLTVPTWVTATVEEVAVPLITVEMIGVVAIQLQALLRISSAMLLSARYG